MEAVNGTKEDRNVLIPPQQSIDQSSSGLDDLARQQDITETNSLKSNYSEVTARLKRVLLDWYNSLPPKKLEEGAGTLTYPWPGRKWQSVTEGLENGS